jgi:hypothetical protein
MIVCSGTPGGRRGLGGPPHSDLRPICCAWGGAAAPSAHTLRAPGGRRHDRPGSWCQAGHDAPSLAPAGPSVPQAGAARDPQRRRPRRPAPQPQQHRQRRRQGRAAASRVCGPHDRRDHQSPRPAAVRPRHACRGRPAAAGGLGHKGGGADAVGGGGCVDGGAAAAAQLTSNHLQVRGSQGQEAGGAGVGGWWVHARMRPGCRRLPLGFWGAGGWGAGGLGGWGAGGLGGCTAAAPGAPESMSPWVALRLLACCGLAGTDRSFRMEGKCQRLVIEVGQRAGADGCRAEWCFPSS